MRTFFTALLVSLGMIAFSGAPALAAQTDGVLDTSFQANLGSGFTGTYIKALKAQPDQKVLVAGLLVTQNGTNTGGLMRFNADGTLDSAFTANQGSGYNGVINSVDLLSDGSIIVGGNYTRLNGAVVSNLTKINADGTPNTAFNSAMGTGMNSGGVVYTVSVSSSDDIFVGGSFTTLNGVAVPRLIKMNSAGVLDNAFNANEGSGPSATVYSIVQQPDGKILAAGSIINFNGSPAGGLVRLESNGVRDTSLQASFSGALQSMALNADGTILVGGIITSYAGTSVTGLVKLSSNGILDTAFQTQLGTVVGSLKKVYVLPDTRIVVAGLTTVNSTPVGKLAVLKPTGLLDPSFQVNIGTGANNTVETVTYTSNSELIVAGNFTTLNAAPASWIAKLSSSFENQTVANATPAAATPAVLANTGISGTNVAFLLFAGSIPILAGIMLLRIVKKRV